MERLERRVDAVHRPAARRPLFDRLGMRALPGALPLLAQAQRRIAHLGGGRLFRVELHDAEHEIVDIGVKVGDHGARVYTDTAEDDAAERLLAVDLEDPVGDERVQPLLFRSDALMEIVLSPPRARAVELAGTRCVECGQPGSLHAVVRRDLEEAGGGAVVHDCENGPELLESQELAYQRLMIDRQSRPVHVGQRQRLEQSQLARGEDRDGAGARQVVRLFEIVEHLPQTGRDHFAVFVRQCLSRQGTFTLPHAVLHLDEILAARAVARLELQVTGDHPVTVWLDRCEPRNRRPGVLFGNGCRECAHDLEEHRFAIGSPHALERVPDLV